jgi:hypothetical protein
MKPSALRPGDTLRRLSGRGANPSRVYTFLRIEPGQPGRRADAVLRCEDYRGLNGPDDAGLCTVSAGELARHFERVSP